MKFLKPLVGILALQKAAGTNFDPTNSDGKLELQNSLNHLNVAGQEDVLSQLVQADGGVVSNNELGYDFYFAEADKNKLLMFESLNAEDKKMYSGEVLSLINKAIELNPEAKHQYHIRGQAYLHLDENDKALMDFQKEMEINPNPTSCNEIGIIYSRKGENEKAAESFSKAIKDIKLINFEGAYYNRGVMYEQMGYPRKALEDFNKELEMHPSYQNAIHRKENIYPFLPHFEHEKSFIAAKEYFEQFLKEKEAGEDGFSSWEMAIRNFDEARSSFLKHFCDKNKENHGRIMPSIENINKFATPLEKEVFEEYLTLGEVIKDSSPFPGQEKNAEVDFADMVKIRPNVLQERHDRARKHLNEGKCQDALHDIDRVISLAPNRTWANYDLAAVLDKKNDHAGAIEFFTKEIDLNTDSLSRAYKERAHSYLKSEKIEEAVLDLDRAINTSTYYEERNRMLYQQAVLKMRFVKSLKETGDFEKLDNFLSGNVIGSNPLLRVEKAEVRSSLGLYESAINHYTVAIANGADDADKLYLKIAELHQHLGRKEEALHDVNRSLKIKPSDEAYLERSHINWQLGNYGEAIEDFDRVNPGFVGASIISYIVICAAAGLGLAKLAIDANRRNNPPPVIRENNPPPVIRENSSPIDVNETYPRETYGPSIKGYARDLLHYCASYEDMAEEENGELQKNAIFNLGKESFSRIIKKVLNARYEAHYNYDTKDGKDFSIFDFSIGHRDNDPYFKERFVSEIELSENAGHEQKMEFIKNVVRKEVADFLDSFAEDLLHEVKNKEEKEFLKSILLTCLETSHQCDLTFKYNIRGGERDKNMLYDRIAKSGDYTIVDPDKLADGKAIFREGALEYFMDIYEKIAEEKIAKEKLPNQAEQKEAPKANFKPEEKSSLIGSDRTELVEVTLPR